MFLACHTPALRAMTLAVALAAPALAAHAQSGDVNAIPEIPVTADRVEEPIGQTGASVSVIPADQIEKFGSVSVADVLRDVAGVEVVNSGGVGALTQVRLRGSQPGETLVLLDGVRIGAATATDGSFDFGNLAPTDIERIEVLRGPQSALYGSDAMGGVINIITRKGSKTTKRSVTIQGGSYGTLSTQATMSGGDDKWTYSLGVDALHSNGFPRYGYRVPYPLVIGDGVTPLPPLPADDPVNKGGATAHFSYRASDDVTVEFGGSLFGNAFRFDNPGAVIPSNVFNTYNQSQTWIGNGFVRAIVDPRASALKSQITVFGNRTNMEVSETEACYDINFNAFNCRNSYIGGRYGAEYQGDLKLGAFGALTFGAKTETETANTNESPNPNDGSFTPISARQTTNSVYAEERLPLFSRIDLTFGGRVDAIENGSTFATWRTTIAYHIDEAGTKLRASAGTGDKAATLYQRFSVYGAPGLAPENSIGYDFGVDQKLFDGRLTLSATVFDTRYTDLIAFGTVPSCSAAQIAGDLGCYYNVNSADSRGLELQADAVVTPGLLKARATYTYTNARDLGGAPGDPDAGLQLYHIPRNQGSLTFLYTPSPKWEIDPRLTLVGPRLDAYFNYATYSTTNVVLTSYAKLDVLATYHATDNLTAFARVENLTNAVYQEVYGYGTAGRSYYAGLSYSW